jgi:hypothetical protein
MKVIDVSMVPYSVTLLCACAAPAAVNSVSESVESAVRFICFSGWMNDLVIA